MNRKLGVGLFLLPCVGAFCAAGPVRLAIVPKGEGTELLAAVLTVAVSKQPGVAVLERADIQKVYGEQALGSGAKDALKLGQMLGADGVWLLEVQRNGTNSWLDARLVAVKPGVVLASRQYPFPVEAAADWPGLALKQFAPSLAKLAVLPKDAVPISILNLRAAVRSAEVETLERELTLLLHDHLSREREIFVLERRRLDQLAQEKELKETAESPFWSGSYLLEGLINKEGFSSNSVTISARLVPPDKRDAVAIEVVGNRANLPAVITNLTMRILAALKRSGPKSEWSPSTEADQYFDEAKWAFRWGMMQEAQTASDASWALGKNTAEVALLRIRAWRETGVNQAICYYERESGRVTFGTPFNANQFDSRLISSFGSLPEADRFNDLTVALDLYERGFQTLVARQGKLDKTWFDLGVTLLGDLTPWLRQYYFTVEARAGQEDKIAETKSAAWRILAMLNSHPDSGNIDTNHVLANTKAKGAALWSDTPEQGVAAYRELLLAGDWPRVRGRFLKVSGFKRESDTSTVLGSVTDNLDPVDPALAGWKWENRKRCPLVWERFVDELRNSTDPLANLEGRYTRCSAAWSGEDFERELRELLGAVWQQREAIRAGHLEAGWLQDLRTLVSSRSESLAAAQRQRVNQEIWSGFEKQFAGLIQSSEERKQVEVVLEYFKTQPTLDFISFTKMLNREYSADQARELLPLLKSYKERVSKPASAPQQKQVDFWTGRLEAKLNRVLTSPATNAPAPAEPRTPPVAAGTNRISPLERNGSGPGITPQFPALTNRLRVTRFWSLRPRETEGPAALRSPVVDVCFRDGQLWVQYFENETYDGGRRSESWGVCRIEPETFKTEYIPFDQYTMPYPRPGLGGFGDRSFDVFRGALYVGAETGIQRYALSERTWLTVDVPVSSKAKVQRLGQRLFITTADSILEIAADGNGGQVLASTRRRPAQSALDNLGGLNIPDLFLGGSGDVRTFISGNVYSRPLNSNDWVVIASSSGGATGRSTVGDDSLVIEKSAPFSERKLLGMFAGRPSFELLLLLPSQAPRIVGPNIPKPSPQAVERPKWSLPPATRLIGSTLCVEGERLYFFSGEVRFEAKAGQANLKEETSHPALLYLFETTKSEPLVIPLQLEFPVNLISGLALNHLVSMGAGQILLRSTPKGLVIMRSLVPGFWFIPRGDLDKYCAELARGDKSPAAGKSATATNSTL